jgi:hypothetical protein
MPTLNGFLLGYPVVYVVESPSMAQSASRLLSTDHITVFKCCALVAPEVGHGTIRGGAAQNGFAPAFGKLSDRREDMITLCACSLPTSLLNELEEPDCGSSGCSQHFACIIEQYMKDWRSRIQSAMTGQGWSTRLSWRREDMGIQPVSL